MLFKTSVEIYKKSAGFCLQVNKENNSVLVETLNYLVINNKDLQDLIITSYDLKPCGCTTKSRQ